MSNIGAALETLWRRSKFLGAGWWDGVGCGCGNSMVILVAMEGPGRGPACAFETSTMMWGSLEFRIVYFINSVQPATGLVLHGWAYYLWLGGHYGAGVTLVI